MPNEQTNRDHGIDALRGFAIAAMVASHLARDVLASPHPLGLRIFGSLAAPLFIALSGMLVAQTAERKQYPLSYYAQRGGTILLLAALIDLVIWGIYPLIGFDVLCLIGVALPLTALFCRLPFPGQAAVLAAVVLIPSGLRSAWGYPEGVFAVALGDDPAEIVEGSGRIVQQWLWTGWFPILPWLGFAFFGAGMFRWRQQVLALRLVAASLVAIGIGAYLYSPTPLYERGGYTELFYPPTIAFLLISAGATLALCTIASHPVLRENPPLAQLGRCALLIYIAHLAILHWGVMPLVGEVDLPTYLAIYAALLLVLIGLAGAVELGKRRFPRRLPFMLRLLLGS